MKKTSLDALAFFAGKSPKERLRNRYDVFQELGRGAQGVTYAGLDRQSGHLVAVKELHLSHAESWKTIELFERETHALRSLNHRAIPRYIDAFHLEETNPYGKRFFLVQEYIEGRTLTTLLKERGRFSERKAWRFLREMLEILDYLHGLSPPIIHRDIKPSNILQRPDRSFALIDFGGVQMQVAQTIDGSTVVGTAGYMAPEQLLGRAAPASDLYSLGATAIYLLTGKEPAHLTSPSMELRFRIEATLSQDFAAILTKMIALNPEDRFARPREVIEALDRKSSARLSLDHPPEYPDPDQSAAPKPEQGIVVGVLGFFSLIGLAILVLGFWNPWVSDYAVMVQSIGCCFFGVFFFCFLIAATSLARAH